MLVEIYDLRKQVEKNNQAKTFVTLQGYLNN